MIKQVLLSLLMIALVASLHLQASKYTYTVAFLYGARQGQPFDTSKIEVLWDNTVLGTVTPADYNINKQIYVLPVTPGKHKLTFKGAGTSDGYGATISKVTLTSNYGKPNQYDVPVENFEFSKPNTGK